MATIKIDEIKLIVYPVGKGETWLDIKNQLSKEYPNYQIILPSSDAGGQSIVSICHSFTVTMAEK